MGEHSNDRRWAAGEATRPPGGQTSNPPHAGPNRTAATAPWREATGQIGSWHPIGVMEPPNHSPGRRSPPERETGAVHPAAPLRLLSPVASGNAHRSAASHSVPIDSHRIALLVDCGPSAGPSTLAAMPLGLDRFRHDRLADADRPPRLPSALTTPALSETSQTTGTNPPSVEPLHCDPAERGQEGAEQGDAEQGDVSDARWAVFQELRPQFEVLPASVVRDCVDHAVQDLLGSINVEA